MNQVARPRSSSEFVLSSTDRRQLYSEFAPLVRRLTLQFGTSAGLREDLAGEIYCRFCGLLDGYDSARGIPLRPYLIRQLHASTYTFVRAYRRSSARELPLDPELDQVHSDLQVNPTLQWDEALLLESARGHVKEALAALSERQRSVVLWRYYHDFTFEEIAERLDIETSTARSLLRHGLAAMKRYLVARDVVLA